MIKHAFLLALIISLVVGILVAGTPAVATGTYQAKVLTLFEDDLIAYWPLNETSGTTANDVSGNGRHGTYSGVTLDQVDGPGETMGRAGLWDGINDRVRVVSSISTTEFTVLGWWTQLNCNANTQHPLVSAIGSGSVRFDVAKSNSPGYWYWRIHNGSTNYVIGGMVYPEWCTSSWWLSGMIVTATEMRVVFGPSIPRTMQISVDSLTWTEIGIGFAPAVSWYHYGHIAHVMFFNRALTLEEIIILADPSPLPPSTTPTPLPLSHYYTLDSGQPVRVDFAMTGGDALITTTLLVVLGLAAMLVFLQLVRRR